MDEILREAIPIETFYHQFSDNERLYFRLYIAREEKLLFVRSIRYAKAEEDFGTGLKTVYIPVDIRLIDKSPLPCEETVWEGMGDMPVIIEDVKGLDKLGEKDVESLEETREEINETS